MTDPGMPGGVGLPESHRNDAQTDPSEAGQREAAPDVISAQPPPDAMSPPAPSPSEGGTGFAMPAAPGFGGPSLSEGTSGSTIRVARGPRFGRGRLVILVVMLGFLAVAIVAVKDNTAPNDLQVGDCFDVPGIAGSVETVVHHPCTVAHTGEVIDIATYGGSGTSYPSAAEFDAFVTQTCNPVFQTYVGGAGNADLSMGYIYPLENGWSNGDRIVTCYAARIDGAQMTQSVKGSGTPSGSASP
jgi:hypothetical protein